MTISFIILTCLAYWVYCEPELLQLQQKSSCIKNVVKNFVDEDSCDHLHDGTKSKLALEMTNCLLIQMGRSRVECSSVSRCPELNGQSWDTFTTFYAHIDNLCHFYWDINRAEKADEMIEALVNSAVKTQESLKENNRNTREIINLQNSLKLQILASLTSQEEMGKIINSSSLTITTLTESLQNSLEQIHKQIGTHYAVISKILAGINHIIDSLSVIQQIFISELTSFQGMLYFILITVLFILGCLWSQRFRIRKNECIMLIGTNIILEYCLYFVISLFVSVEIIRGVILLTMAILILSVDLSSEKYRLERVIKDKLTTDRLQRIVSKAIQKRMREIEKHEIRKNRISSYSS